MSDGWQIDQAFLDIPQVRSFLNQYHWEREKFPPLDVPGMKKKKVAICGLATTTRGMAPFGDPDCDIWCCMNGFKILPRVDVTFEIHDPEIFAKHPEQFEKDYWEDLKKLNHPVFMQ